MSQQLYSIFRDGCYSPVSASQVPLLKETLSLEERVHHALAVGNGAVDPTPFLLDYERAEYVYELYYLLHLLLDCRIRHFFSCYRKLPYEIQVLLREEVVLTQGSLERLLIPLPLQDYKAAFRPLIQALARLAERIASKGGFSPYLSDSDIEEIASDLRALETDPLS